MKSTTKNEKIELASLQKENSTLRNQLKSLGNRLNDLIDQKDSEKGKKIGLNVNPEDELREVRKLIEIYKKEKQSLSKRLKKVLDLDYFNTLSLKIENDMRTLNSSKNSQKVAELFEKKENFYKQSPIKSNGTSEFEVLNSKRHHLLTNIEKLEEKVGKNSDLIEENKKKLNDLDEERKQLLETLGEPYLREQSMKKMLETINKKKKIEKLIQKETNSKVNSMLIKIKSLQNELKNLKESEYQLNSQILNVSMQADEYNDRLRLTPIGIYTKKNAEVRSRSVRPNVNKTFLTKY